MHPKRTLREKAGVILGFVNLGFEFTSWDFPPLHIWRMSELKFSPGKAVEVSLDPEDSLDIWYPATLIKETSKGSFEVEYKKSDNIVPLHAVVDCHHIRPSPPVCDNEIFQLLTKVDAFCNSGWSSGVVTKVLAEGRYIVYFKRTKKEKELKHTDLRLPILQSHGKWAHSSQVASVISNTRENKDISLSANGKISFLPENPGIIKESGETLKSLNDKSRSVSSVSTDGDIQNKTLPTIRKKPQRNKSFKELNAESAPEELRSPLEVCGMKTAQAERLLEKESSVELSMPGVKSNTPVEQPENGKSTVYKVATPERSMVALEENSDLPLSRRTPFTGNGGRGRSRGRPFGSKTKNRASVAGTAAAPEPGPVSLAECFQGHFGKPIVISLPCYNSQWNKLQAQGTDKLPMRSLNRVQEEEQLPREEKQVSLEEKKQLPQEKKKQLLSSVAVGSTVNNLDNNKPETEGLNNENGIPRRKRGGPFDAPRRKRGRPFGSFSLEKRKQKEAEAAAASILSNTQRRSTRERREVYKSIIDKLKPRTKKLRVDAENPSPTQEGKDEGVKTFSLTEYVEPISHGVSGNMSDDLPLSTWFGEAHSLPNHTKPNSSDHDSQSDKLVEQTDPERAIQHMEEETVGVTDVDLVPSASQDEVTTMESKGDKVTDLVVNGKGLPFSKTSPIWEMIESMEIFKKIPQNPHFTPLYATKEHCREGQAISSMVTFSHLVEDISKSKFDDPHSILEERAETLSDLERQGFNIEAIRSRLNTLLTIKTEQNPAQTLEKEIAQEQKQKAVADKEMAELERKMAELREKQALVALEKEKIDSNLRELQSRFEPVREVLEGARSEFASLASAPW